MNQYLELCIQYEQDRKLIIFDNKMTFLEFKEDLKKEFKIGPKDIKLIDIKRNAEITSAHSLKEENEIELSIKEAELVNSDEKEIEKKLFADTQESYEINFDDLTQKLFQEKSLVDELNKWANYHGFHLIVCEGKQLLKNSTKRTLKCNIKDCQYKIIFKSDDKNGNNYQVCEKLSQKYTKHSISFLFLNNLFFRSCIDLQKIQRFYK